MPRAKKPVQISIPPAVAQVTADEEKGINISAVIGIVVGAAHELREDLQDGFQLHDATDFIGNVARGFHGVFGGWILSTVASLCGK